MPTTTTFLTKNRVSNVKWMNTERIFFFVDVVEFAMQDYWRGETV